MAFSWFSVQASMVLAGLTGSGLVGEGTDSATETESAVSIRVDYPNTLETFTVSESAVAQLIAPAVTDSVTVSESLTLLVTVNRTESLTITDLATATGGSGAVQGAESYTVTDTMTTLLAPVANTDSSALTDTTFAVDFSFDNSTEVFTLSESAVGQLGGSAVLGSETATLSETGLAQGIAAGTDSATVSEAWAAQFTPSPSETVTLSESVGTVPLVVVASDACTVTESGSVTSGNAGVDFQALTVSDAITGTLIATATDSLSITDSMTLEGTLAQTDSTILSEVTSTSADLVGKAEIGGITISPRLLVNLSAGRIAYTCDSSLITCDSTLVTVDGAYVGDMPVLLGVRVRDPMDDIGVGDRVGGFAEVGI